MSAPRSEIGRGNMELRNIASLALRHGGNALAFRDVPRTTEGFLRPVAASVGEPPRSGPEITAVVPLRPEKRTPAVAAQPERRPVAATDSALSVSETGETQGNGSPIHVRLGMFSPEVTLCETEFAAHYVDTRDVAWLTKIGNKEAFEAIEAKRKARVLQNHPETSAQEYDTHRAQQVKELTEAAKRSINNRVYRTIMEDFDLPSMEHAYTFWERQRKNANDAVLRHGEEVYPEGTPYQLNNEVELPARPADLVSLFVAADTPPKLRQQIKRQFLLGHIAAEIEMSEKNGADHKLSQIQKLLDDKFYSGPSGENQHVVLYGVFNSETNKFDAKRGVSETVPEDVSSDSHVKTLKTSTRTIADTGEHVFTMLGKKNIGDGARKGIRKAQRYEAERHSDEVRPDIDVKDTHRMMIVVLGDGVAANRVVDNVFDIIADGQNVDYFVNRNILGDPIMVNNKVTGVPEDVTISNESKSDEEGKCDTYSRRRILIDFNGMQNPVEIIVQTMAEHLSSELEIGKYVPEKGKYNGPAHPLMAVSRERKINSILFDDQTYEELPQPGAHDDDQPLPRLRSAADKLITTRHVMLGNGKTI